MKKLMGIAFIALLAIGSCDYQKEVLKEEYYPNNNIKRKYNLSREGLVTGTDSIFRIDGTLSEVSIWEDGRLIDSIVNYDYEGNISTIGKIQGDELIFYRKNGTKESEVNLSEGLKNGLQTYYGANGQVIGFKGFKNNMENGVLIHLNENHTPKYIKQLNEDEGNQIITSHYSDGLLKSFRVYDSSDNGFRLLFHPNGTLKQIGEIKKGKAHGLKLFFTDGGELIKKSHFKNGDLVSSF